VSGGAGERGERAAVRTSAGSSRRRTSEDAGGGLRAQMQAATLENF